MDDTPDRRPRDSRNEILDAAQKVVSEKGAGHLTIDAVASVSGFSKGGVLYNFPSKTALIQGLLDRTMLEYEERLDAAREELSGNNRTLRAVLQSHFDTVERCRPLFSSFLVAMAEDPRFLETVQPKVRERVAEVAEEAEDPELALIVWLAIEGMTLLNALDLYKFPDVMREQIEDRLRRMAT